MKLNLTGLSLILVWCLFMGVTAISIGIGAVFPPLNMVAKPFVCANGQMNFETHVSNPLPGTTYVQTGWNCVDNQTGSKKVLEIFPMSLYAGLIYGLLLFVVVFFGMVFLNWRASNSQTVQNRVSDAEMNQLRGIEESEKTRGWGNNQPDLVEVERKTKAATDVVTKMTELKKLRDANLISDAEYESKRAEILKEL